MDARFGRPSWGTFALGLWSAFGSVCPGAHGQEVPQAPQASLPTPAAPATGVPPAPAPPAPVTVEQLAERLRAMEEMNRGLAEELARTRSEHAEQMKEILSRLEGRSSRPLDGEAESGLNGKSVNGNAAAPKPNVAQKVDIPTPVPDYTEGQFAPFTPPPGFELRPPPEGGRKALHGSFGPGFLLETDDEEYRLLIHYESQIEGRVWEPNNHVPANSGFFMPRQRIFFNGNITKPIEYEFSINRGFGALNILNAYLNFHFNDQFELRIGRFFTPLPYDQYAISNYWLPTPERSIFTTNVGLNRQIGVMGWGFLFDKRLDYAAGVFNGSRNSFENLNGNVDAVGYLNARPFQESESLPFLRFLNVGTSVAYGYQNQSPVPVSFRIAGGSPNSDVPGPGTVPFLILNPGVVEHGERLVGSVHAAYFYKSLSLISEWQYGYGGYAIPGRVASTQVPFSGFYATAAYFLTGEEIERRSRLVPLRPFITTQRNRAKRGIGAWELVGRVSQLSLGEQIFTSGFADPHLWSNRATTTEVGLNWYWNEYIKIYTFWLHGEFGDPVQYGPPGDMQKRADMFWMRFQLYF